MEASNVNFNSPGIFMSLLQFYIDMARKGILTCIPYAEYLIAIFGIIDLATSWWLYDGELKFNILIQKILKISFFYFLIINWAYLTNLIATSFGFIGYLAGGHDIESAKKLVTGAQVSDQYVNPSALIDLGDKQASNISKLIFNGNSFSIGGTILAVICYLLIKLGFFFMAIQLVLTNIEFAVFTLLSVVLMPFGCLKFTRFLSQRAISGVFSFGIKLMVVYFLVGLIGGLAGSMEDTFKVLKTTEDFKSSLGEVGKVAMAYVSVGYLTWKLPNIIQSMLNGTPSFGNDITPGSVMRATGAAVAAPYAATAGAAKAYSYARNLWQSTAAGAAAGAATTASASTFGSALSSGNSTSDNAKSEKTYSSNSVNDIPQLQTANGFAIPGISSQQALENKNDSLQNPSSSTVSAPVLSSKETDATANKAINDNTNQKITFASDTNNTSTTHRAINTALQKMVPPIKHVGRFSKLLAGHALMSTHLMQNYMEGARNANITNHDIDRVAYTWKNSQYTDEAGIASRERATRSTGETTHSSM